MEATNTQEKGLNLGEVVAGKYRLIEELGRGAMGVVYRAVQESMSREVALKTLLPHAIVHPSLVARFKREVKVISQLKHPNTITIFDYGTLEDGLLYFAMELLEGVGLDDIIKAEGTLEAERVRQIAIQILKSLSEAHAKGIIHRDLKPQNIFVCDVYGERDFVKVLDFGIAKALDSGSDSAGSAPDVTGTGVTLGTPVYMAPEQIDQEAVSPSTDLYALGALIYEMLGGRQLFHGSGWLKIAMKKMGKAPVELRNDILYGPFGGIILKAVQKRPEDRYQSPQEMLSDLEALGMLEGVPRLPRVHAAVTSTTELESLLVPGVPPRVVGGEEPGALQDPMVSAPTTLTPQLQRPGSSPSASAMPALHLELSAEEPTRISTPAFNDVLDVQATGEFDKDRTQLMGPAAGQPPSASPLLTEPISHPGAEATQLIREYDASALELDAEAALGGASIKSDDKRKAIVTLLLLGLGLVVVAVAVIAGLLVLNLR